MESRTDPICKLWFLNKLTICFVICYFCILCIGCLCLVQIIRLFSCGLWWKTDSLCWCSNFTFVKKSRSQSRRNLYGRYWKINRFFFTQKWIGLNFTNISLVLLLIGLDTNEVHFTFPVSIVPYEKILVLIFVSLLFNFQYRFRFPTPAYLW